MCYKIVEKFKEVAFLEEFTVQHAKEREIRFIQYLYPNGSCPEARKSQRRIRASSSSSISGSAVRGSVRVPWKEVLRPGGGGGLLSQKLGGGERPASQNSYPAYDQNLRYSGPTLFMTWPTRPYLCPEPYINLASIDTLFMIKTAENPYPLGPHIPI